MAWPYRLTAYDPKTGKELWLSKGVGPTIYNTPAWGENTLVAMSSGMDRGSVVAVRPGGSSDVTESRRRWQAGSRTFSSRSTCRRRGRRWGRGPAPLGSVGAIDPDADGFEGGHAQERR